MPVCWPFVIAAFTFGPDDDVILVERLGAMAGRAGGPVLAADPALVGCSSFAETQDPVDSPISLRMVKEL